MKKQWFKYEIGDTVAFMGETVKIDAVRVHLGMPQYGFKNPYGTDWLYECELTDVKA